MEAGSARSAPRQPARSALRVPAEVATLKAETVALQQVRPRTPMPNRQGCSSAHDLRTCWIDWTSVISLSIAAEPRAHGGIASESATAKHSSVHSTLDRYALWSAARKTVCLHQRRS